MGRSTASCLKIITCGRDSVDHDELEAPTEGSSDKRGWSFRKKSTKHRVLSNTVVSETPSTNKDWPEPTNADLQTLSNSTIPKKTSAVQWADEKSQFTTNGEPQLSAEEKSQFSADDKPQFFTEDKLQVLADEKPQVSAEEKLQVLADEKPQVLTDEKPQFYAEEKPQVSVEEKLQVSEEEKPQVSAEEKPQVSAEEKPQVSAEEKPQVSAEEKLQVSADKKPQVMAEEKPQVSASVEARLSGELTTINDGKDDVTPDEQVVLVIQTAIRAFGARRVLLKHKNITKLQAAVRGHLVRRHALGTLRCVQAIVKMQALVRARHGSRLAEGSSISEKLNGNESSGTKSGVTYTPIVKHLSNRFARQLLESTPVTRRVNIKCDPSKSDSAWKWLERWMTVSATGKQQSAQAELSAEQHQEENIEHSSNLVESKVQLESNSEAMELSPGKEASASEVPSESDENLITYYADNLDLQAHVPSLPQPQNVGENNSRDDSLCSIPTQLDELPVMEPLSLPAKTEIESEEGVHSFTSVSLEPLQPEDKKMLNGSRKANPAFIAAQSKFEELSTATNSSKVSNLSNHEADVKSYEDTVSSTTDHAFGATETALSENSVPHSARIQIGGSECGTELSISSTLDSPDRSEFGAHEFEQELKPSEDGTGHHKSNQYSHIEDDSIIISKKDLSYSNYGQVGKEDRTDDANSEHIDVVVCSDLSHPEQKPENNTVNVLIEHEAETAGQVYKSSPEASPSSHVTFPESQGTPSSQVSVKPKKNRKEKGGPNPNRWLSTGGKRSPSNPNHDSGTTSSEQLPKDHKSAKRRTSFGSAKAGHVDQEARDSSSSSSLPSYMQATESARAKAIANSSPRSSPDVQSKDEYIKKRHSLPGSNGRHGSPHIQRSLSNTQQGAKANGTQSPNERKWQR